MRFGLVGLGQELCGEVRFYNSSYHFHGLVGNGIVLCGQARFLFIFLCLRPGSVWFDWAGNGQARHGKVIYTHGRERQCVLRLGKA